MSNSSSSGLKTAIMAAVLVGATAAGAYILYSKHAGHANEATPKNPTKETKSKKFKKKRGEKGQSSKASSVESVELNAQPSIPKDDASPKSSIQPNISDPAELNALCDASIDELLGLEVEEKQKVFYALLLRGEMLMNQGKEEACIGYFAKAVALVPNPAEIMAAFEKTLPKSVFSALILSLQGEIMKKTEKYFDILSKETNETVTFEAGMSLDPLGNPVRRFTPKAKTALRAGQVLFEEKPDVVVKLAKESDCCEWDLKPVVEEEMVGCEKHADAKYCSDACRKMAFDYFHMYTCEVRGEKVVNSIAELKEHCLKTNSYIALLMLHYVSMLLTEELRGNGAAMHGPFAHYDHLPQCFPDPTEEDRKEAALIRSVFTTSNENLADFLTDQIYASMKATLNRACFRFNSGNPEGIVEAPWKLFQKVIGSNLEVDAVGLYHLIAHLPHSCDPNVQLEIVPGSGSVVRVTAIKEVKPEEPLTISWSPVDGMQTEMRKERLFLNYMLNCECAFCKN